MSVIPCKIDPTTRKKVDEIAEALKTQAHTLAPGTTEREFYDGCQTSPETAPFAS